MATTFTPYDHTHRRFFDGTLDWDTDTFNLALVANTYTFSGAHTQWSDVSTHEVANGDGYTTGGAALANQTLTNTKIDADDVTFTALTKVFRYGVLYKVGTANGLTNPLVGCILFDDTPADVSVTNINFSILWDSLGIGSL
jgi:hypothetical protein